MKASTLKLTPYLHFDGNCEEAVSSYKSIFNGNLDIKRFETAPMEVPESHKSKVLHAVLTFGNNTIMASDSFPGSPVTRGNDTVLSLELENEKQAREIYEALTKDGKIIMPLERQFWGAIFGQLEDRFGVRWMVSGPRQS